MIRLYIVIKITPSASCKSFFLKTFPPRRFFMSWAFQTPKKRDLWRRDGDDDHRWWSFGDGSVPETVSYLSWKMNVHNLCDFLFRLPLVWKITYRILNNTWGCSSGELSGYITMGVVCNLWWLVACLHPFVLPQLHPQVLTMIFGQLIYVCGIGRWYIYQVHRHLCK